MHSIYESRFHNSINFQNSKFNIVVCEIYNPNIHGIDENSDPEIQGHYLAHYVCDYDYSLVKTGPYVSDSDETDDEEEDDDDDENTSSIYEIIDSFKEHISNDIIPNNNRSIHPFIRNYKTIISNEHYIKPEIAKCVYLKGDECVAILKTFWLRIVQRTWKRIFKEKKATIALRLTPKSLNYRERNGKWPLNCCRLPRLKGMLSKLRPRK